MNRRLLRRLGVATTALALGQAAPVLAQTAAPRATPSTPQETAPTQDIVVTARRIDERLRDVPISITVFNQSTLQDRNIVNAQDLATITPSLSSNANFGSENSAFAIRGFVQDIGTQPSVGVFFADVVAPRGAANNFPVGDGAGPGSVFDLPNVQVLKGPQGTLFGRNTTGGDILLVPVKPTGRFEGYAEASYGNYDMREFQAVVNLPVSDTVRFRVGVDRNIRDGYMHNTTGIGASNLDNVDYTAVRASLVIDITPNLENYTIFSWVSSNTNGTAQKLIACDPTQALGLGLACPALARNAGQGFYDTQSTLANPYSHTNKGQFINTTTWRANDNLIVKNIFSYAQLEESIQMMEFGVDFHLSDLNNAFFGGAPLLPNVRIPFATVSSIDGGDTAHESTLTEELQVQYRSDDGRFTGQTGVYFEESDPLSTVGSQGPLFLNCTNSATMQCTDYTAPYFGAAALGGYSYSSNRTFFHDAAAYAQATYAITDRLKITGGVRYTSDVTTVAGQQISYKFYQPNTPTQSCTLPQSDPSTCAASYREASSAPTGMVDLEYKPNNDVLGYIKYSRGYRGGGVSFQAPTGYNTFAPEQVNTYEAGVKTSFHGPLRGSFDVTGFYNDFSNQQLQFGLASTSVSPASAIFNAGQSRIYGAEVEASLIPIHNLVLSLSYTYLNTDIVKIAKPTIPADSPYTLQPPANPGDPLVLSPANKASLTAAYTLPLNSRYGKLSFSVNGVYTDKQLANYVDRLSPYAQPYAWLKATTLMNLSINWKNVWSAPVDLSVFGTNVTNLKYYAIVPGLITSVGFETGEVAPPAMYGVRLRYHFGD